jgi:hypothetical protein
VQSESVPGPTPELLIVLADLEVKREKHGNDWCRRHGVGARRLYLGRALPTNVVSVNPPQSPKLLEYLKAKQTAQETLAMHCHMCGGCKLAKE